MFTILTFILVHLLSALRFTASKIPSVNQELAINRYSHHRQNIVSKPKGQSRNDNPETHATKATGQRPLCENRRTNQELITKRHRQHWAQQRGHCAKTEGPIKN